MATLPVANTFAGGTNGVTISAANSGGASGDAFDFFDNSSNPTMPKYSNAESIHSSTLCMAVVDIPSGNAKAGWTNFNGGSGYTLTDVWARCYIWLIANPSGGFWQFQIAESGSSTNSFLRISTSGKLVMTVKASGTGGFTSTNSIPTGQWVRMEQRVKADITAGELECKIWWTDPDSTGTADEESGSLTGKVLQTNLDGWMWGVHGAPPTAPFTGYIADVAVSTSGWIGPTGGTPPPPTTQPSDDFPFSISGRGAGW